MRLHLRPVLLCAALLLSSALVPSNAGPASAATDVPPDTVPVTEVPGTPRSVHVSEGGTVESGNLAPESLQQQSVAGLARRGDIKITLVTVQLADTTASQVNSISIEAAKSSVTATSNYWKAMSNNRLSMSVESVRAGFRSSATSGQTYFDISATVAREIGWVNRPYTALVVFVPTASLWGGALGFGASSGDAGGRILMPMPSKFSNNVMAHEFGHVLGLMHADSLQCGSGISDVGPNGSGGFADPSCSLREYGDTTDIMGAAQYAMPALSSSFWDRWGYGRGDEVLDLGIASGSTRHTLKAWAGTEAQRAVKFTDPKSGETYYIELRLPVGYDASTAVNGNRGVKILQSGGSSAASSVVLMPSTKPFTGYYAANHTWQAGQTFTTHAGTKVTVDYINDSSAGVTINTGLPFNDIGDSGFQSDIKWMHERGLSTGWADGTYRPYESMTREAMAAFMYRFAGSPAYSPPSQSPFSDVPPGHPFYKHISWMDATELATGWADGSYRPGESISREAMAAFLNRYAGKHCNVAAAGAAAPAVSPFKDMTPSSAFYKEISWMNVAGISTGWADGTYRPAGDVTREAMAAFIHRSDSYLAAHGGCRP